MCNPCNKSKVWQNNQCLPDPADFVDGKLTCAAPPAAPASAVMTISKRDAPMCPGKTVTYSCDAGGINAFEVRPGFGLSGSW